MVSFSTIHPHICPSETYLSLLILLSWWIVRLVGLGWHLIYILICILHASVYWTSLDQILRYISYNALYYYTSWRARCCPWNFFLKFELLQLKTPPGHPWMSTKKFSPFGPAVWPAIGDIYTNVLFYNKDMYLHGNTAVSVN